MAHSPLCRKAMLNWFDEHGFVPFVPASRYISKELEQILEEMMSLNQRIHEVKGKVLEATAQANIEEKK